MIPPPRPLVGDFFDDLLHHTAARLINGEMSDDETSCRHGCEEPAKSALRCLAKNTCR